LIRFFDFFIRNWVLAVMINLALLVLGLVSWSKLPIALTPDVDFPVITVTTAYPGAGPEEVELLVTKKIEDAVGAVAGIDQISSVSRQNLSVVTISFVLEKDGDVALQEVQQKLDVVLNQLPDGAEIPVVQKLDVASQPIQTWVVSNDQMSQLELRDFVERRIKPRLQEIFGVGRVVVSGGEEREIQVLLKPERLASWGISPQQVMLALRTANLDFPAGNLADNGQDLGIKVVSQFRSPQDVAKTVVDARRGIRVGDLAEVRDHFKPPRQLSRLNGKPAVSVSIFRQSGANEVRVARLVEENIDKLAKELPPSFQVSLIQDQSRFIIDAVNDIYIAIAVGALLATLVVFFFLGNFRSTLVVSVAIPLSLIATFILFFVLGFSINFFSLLALAVAVGLVIDDSIIVVESIHRHLKEGKSPLRAIKEGSAEISLAALASTLAIMAVFVPVGFMTGLIGRFFREFGLGVAMAVGFSLLVALVMIPTAMSFLLRGGEERLRHVLQGHRVTVWFQRVFYQPLERIYSRVIRQALRFRLVTVGVGLLAFLATFPVLMAMPKDFIPQFDQGEYMVEVRLPPDRSLFETARVVSRVESVIADYPDNLYIASFIGESGFFPDFGVSDAYIAVRMVPREKRKFTTAEMVAELNRRFREEIGGARVAAALPSHMVGFRKPINFILKSNDLNKLELAARELERVLEEIPGTINVDSSFKRGKLQININPDLAQLARYGLTPADLGRQLFLHFEGGKVGDLLDRGEDYEVKVYLSDPDQREMADLQNASVWSPVTNSFVPLSSLGQLELTSVPVMIERTDRIRSAVVDASVDEGSLLGTGGITQLVLSKVKEEGVLPEGVSLSLAGESEQFQKMGVVLGMALLLGIVFVYMVLASQFNSLTQPFIILLSLPLATFGAVMLLSLVGMSFNLMSFIGIIALTGIVTKNAILLIDYTNLLRRRDRLPRNRALIKAGQVRLRPVLMTALTMILGLVPTALGMGEGGGFRAPMAVAIIGGLTLSTLLTLVVIPVVYTYFDDWFGGLRQRIEEERGESAEETEEQERHPGKLTPQPE